MKFDWLDKYSIVTVGDTLADPGGGGTVSDIAVSYNRNRVSEVLWLLSYLSSSVVQGSILFVDLYDYLCSDICHLLMHLWYIAALCFFNINFSVSLPELYFHRFLNHLYNYLNLFFTLQKFDDLWDILDPDSDSFLHYDKFMRAFIGEMNEYRKSYVIKVFLSVHHSGNTGDVIKACHFI